MVNRLYVSFRDLSLDNLPQGRFERCVIGAGDASRMIRTAHMDKTLQCVSKDDLLAPYRTRERRRHEELCAVLVRATTVLESIMPLQVAELKPGDRMLVLTCDCQLSVTPSATATWTSTLF